MKKILIALIFICAAHVVRSQVYYAVKQGTLLLLYGPGTIDSIPLSPQGLIGSKNAIPFFGSNNVLTTSLSTFWRDSAKGILNLDTTGVTTALIVTGVSTLPVIKQYIVSDGIGTNASFGNLGINGSTWALTTGIAGSATGVNVLVRPGANGKPQTTWVAGSSATAGVETISNVTGTSSGQATTGYIKVNSSSNISKLYSFYGTDSTSGTAPFSIAEFCLRDAQRGSGPHYAWVFKRIAGTNTTLTTDTIVGGLLTSGTLQIPKIQPTTGVVNDGGGMKHSRVTTGSITAGATALVTITWTTAFADANYTVSASVVDATASSAALSVVHVESVTASAVTVRVLNSSAGSLTGTVHVIAMHD